MPTDPNTTPIPQPAGHDVRQEPALTTAAARVLADVEAVRDDDLEPINRDVDTVVTTVLGACRQFAPLLPQIATMPGFDIERARKLDDYASGLLFWHARTSYAAPPKPEIMAMVEQGIVIRERTLHDLRALVRHNLLPASQLEEFGGSTAFRKVAHDLIGLSNLVHDRWELFGGKTMLSLEAMDDAVALATKIMQAIGDRDVAQAEIARDVVRRNKAYTIVIRTYAEVRGALGYLRRVQGDAEKYAPSLFAGKRSGRSDEEEAAPAEKGNTSATATANAASAVAAISAPKSSLIEVDDSAST